jgi:hypothetical protein
LRAGVGAEIEGVARMAVEGQPEDVQLGAVEEFD